jgi:predicted ArsR family transcriptional regulator
MTSAMATSAAAAVLARMRRNTVPLRVTEIAQGADLDEHETRFALIELAATGLVEPHMWVLTPAGRAES